MTEPGTEHEHKHEDAATVAVSIQLQLGAEPIQGTLRSADGLERPFRGWLALTGLLQAAASDQLPDGGD